MRRPIDRGVLLCGLLGALSWSGCQARTINVYVPQAGATALTDRTADAADAGSQVPTFAVVYRDVFVAAGCNSGVCHSSPTAGGLSLRSQDVAYANLVGVPAAGLLAADGGATCAQSGLTRVVPGDPSSSLLMQKLEREPRCGGPMPPGSPVTPDQLRLVRDWIEHGALDGG